MARRMKGKIMPFLVPLCTVCASRSASAGTAWALAPFRASPFLPCFSSLFEERPAASACEANECANACCRWGIAAYTLGVRWVAQEKPPLPLAGRHTCGL